MTVFLSYKSQNGRIDVRPHIRWGQWTRQPAGIDYPETKNKHCVYEHCFLGFQLPFDHKNPYCSSFKQIVWIRFISLTDFYLTRTDLFRFLNGYHWANYEGMLLKGLYFSFSFKWTGQDCLFRWTTSQTVLINVSLIQVGHEYHFIGPVNWLAKLFKSIHSKDNNWTNIKSKFPPLFAI